MSEESPENYNSGDVVWVKLGSSWWPGEVKDSEELPNDILDFKKPPLVIVKFFDEDSYEYIKSWANIYPYNCEKKNDFIKKGMAAFRGKVPHMEKFPKDVLTAEGKVGGNPNILSDPMFLPDKKKNYAAEIFGTPSPKAKANKDKRRSNAKSTQKNPAHVTHRRFLGVDDYRAYICIQYPGKDRIPGDKEDDEVLRINREPEQEFNCHTCSFTTKRLEVMILHTKSHIQGVYVSSPRKIKQTAVRKRKEKMKKARSSDGVVESESTSSDSEPVRERKRKSKPSGAKGSKVKKIEEKATPNQSIRNELLAVWDDTDEEDDELDMSLDKLSKTSQKLSHATLEGVLSGTLVESADEALGESLGDALNKSEAQGEMVEETLEQIRAEVINPSDTELNPVHDALNRSDEVLIQSVKEPPTKLPGDIFSRSEKIEEALDRSIEELLNQSRSPDQSDEKDPEESTGVAAHEPAVEEKPVEGSSIDKDASKDELMFEDAADGKEASIAEKKMDRDIQEAIKSCFDFDEDEEEDNAIVSRAAVGGRKIPRVIPISDRRKSKDIIKDDINRDKILKESESFNRKVGGEGHSAEVDAAFQELMEMTAVPELPEVQNSLKCEQNFHDIKTVKFPDKPEPVGSPPKATKEKKDSVEVATKLTNPKKRFVKSFEDFELMQNEIRRREEQGELPRNEDTESRSEYAEYSSDMAGCSVVSSNSDDYDNISQSSDIEFSRLKSKIMSKIIDEANINEESRTKIMSKIQEAKVEPEAEQTSPSYKADSKAQKYRSPSRRTPRSKILESYMKDTNVQKVEKHEKEKEVNHDQIEPIPDKSVIIAKGRIKNALMKKDVVPPKKNNWSRRGSHPKKDRNLFLLEDIRLDDIPTKEITNDDKAESIALDNQITVDALDTLNVAHANNKEDALDKFMPSATNNDTTLVKDSPEEKITEEVNLPEEKIIEEVNLPEEEITEEVNLPEQKITEEVNLPEEKITEEVNLPEEKITEEVNLPEEKITEEVNLPEEKITEEVNSPEGKIAEEVNFPQQKMTEEVNLTEEKMSEEVNLTEEKVTEEENLTEEKISEEVNLIEENAKLLPTEENDDEIVPVPQESDDPVVDKADSENVISTCDESVKTTSSINDAVSQEDEQSDIVPHSNEEERVKLLLNDEDTETLPTEDQETCELPVEGKKAEKLSSDDDVMDKPLLKDAEIEQPFLEDEQTEQIVSMDEETDSTAKDAVSLVTEVTEKLPSENDEAVSLSKDEATEPCLNDEETQISSFKDEVSESMSPRVKEMDKVESDDQKTEETLVNIEGSDSLVKETDDSSAKENNVDGLLLKEEGSCNLLDIEENSIEKEEEHKAAVVEETAKPDSTLDDCGEEKKESVGTENEIPALTNDISDKDDYVVPSYQQASSVECNKLNSEMTSEEQSPIFLEKIMPVSPSRDFFASVENTTMISPEKSICSPAKNSKKRKMSESNVSACDKSVIVESEMENFSPLEKRKKEMDLPDKDTMPVSEEIELPPNDLKSTKDSIQEEQNTALTDNGIEVSKPDEKMVDASEKDNKIACDVALPAEEGADHANEVEIQCASSSVDSFKFSIQTNLSNLTSREEMSALALATLSEIKADLEKPDGNLAEVRAEQPERSVVLPAPVQSELVPIEGNLTVVSEKDLADGQVEITTEKGITPKKPVTFINFSMDFSDSGSDSNSTNDTLSDISKCAEFASKGTEFTSKAMTKQIKRLDRKKENAYERLELLNILEGNSDSERKPKEYPQPPKKSIMEDICDFEEHIPSQIVCAKGLKRGLIDNEGEYAVKEKNQKMSEKSTASKLLERLTTETKIKVTPPKTSIHSDVKMAEGIKFPTKIQTIPSTAKQTKYIVKSKPPATPSKPIILSEQIVKPAGEATKSKPKRMLNDIEDVEAFVIHKDPKKNKPDDEVDATKTKSAAAKGSAGKAKILQQTIITPAGEIIQPIVSQAQTDDNIFDINSMPIVLSDEILTPESIENMPIVISTEPKPADLEKQMRRPPTQARILTKATVTTTPPILNKTHTITKHSKPPPRILQTVGSKVVKTSPMLQNTAKPGKYIIVPQSGLPPNKYVGKKAPVMKRSPVPTGILTKVPSISPEPSGNKIMIVTNQQGQQQRLLLTPAQQKMLGYQNQKATKTVMKGNVLQKSVLATKSLPLVEAGTSGVASKSPSIIGQKVMVGTNSSPGLITTSSHQIISSQGRNVKNVTKRPPPATQKAFTNPAKQKTILIKNQHGQTVRKIQGTDDELLDKQVAEQLEAIKASSGMKFSSQPKQTETYKITPKSTLRRSYSKKIEMKPKLGPPPLTGIHQSPKPDKLTTIVYPTAKKADSIDVKPTPALVPEEAKTQPDRPLNQLVIQDAVGNQTTITEGQILALPSETVDGQPQSYMLVTLDESGNLTPLNSEALMSLDPNLGLGGDLSNMVLQIDQGALTDRPQTLPIKACGANELAKTVMVESATTVPVPEAAITTEVTESPVVVEQKVEPVVEIPQAVVPSTNGDPGQQLIVTGDPIATQKFLESLTEGTTDLANILANADGNSILIQADGQQILINTNSDNQMLLSMNNDSINVSESTEGGGNPIFATQPNKNQDILAAALADTDVFQQEQHSTHGKITSQLSPSNTLYPMNVGNVLETSLTLSSPIMTPLEVPSTNSKKIPDDEADILRQVPKNVDLPITITDPNISQTANQQVAAMMVNELHTNLELTLPISETTISAVSTEMNSPSFVYSLPTLDDSVDMSQKPFNSSMPLLNEDVEDNTSKAKADEDQSLGNESPHKSDDASNKQGVTNVDGCFLEEEEGRFTLGGEMCSSLSEPPPEMFDLPESTPDVSDNTSKEGDTTDLSTQADTSSEGSCEIPLQPQIVTKSLDLSQNLDSLKQSLEESKDESKKCKFD